MTNFKNFDEFIEHLINHVNDGKDVYIFGWTMNDYYDYSFDVEEDSYEYYINSYINFDDLLSYLTIKLNKEDEYCIIFDKIINVIEEEDLTRLNNRIHIFKIENNENQ